MVSKSVEVILNRKVLSEVEEIFELVAVSIELTVEVLCDKPVRVKEFFRACKTESTEKETLKFIVRNSVLLT